MNDGGQAFPVAGFQANDGVVNSENGMTVRQYYKAHAPAMPNWFGKKIVDEEAPQFAPSGCSDQQFDEYQNARDLWFNGLDDMLLKRWPSYYADAMLADDDAQFNTPRAAGEG